MKKPCEGHLSAAKRVLKYLKGTQDVGLKYTQVDELILINILIQTLMEIRKMEYLPQVML